MTALLLFAEFIDRLNRALGRVAAWLTLAMTVIGALNALLRYLGRFLAVELSSNAYIELQWYLFGVVFLLGAADTLRGDGHVRVDVFYSRLKPRSRHILDLASQLALLLPFCGLGIVMSLPSVQNSWAVWEGSPDPGGLPRYPLKSLLPLAFCLLGLQGLAQSIRNLAALRERDQGGPLV